MAYVSAMMIWLAVCLVFYIPAYVLTGLGLYDLAQRRGIQRPWLAWVPGVNLYTLGCISDQYQAMVRGKNRNKRTALLLLIFAELIAFGAAAYLGMRGGETALLPFLLAFVPAWGAMAAMAVIGYMALYDLYVSCDPKNAVLFLVLSILLGVTQPFFLFACRKKDLGFPL